MSKHTTTLYEYLTSELRLNGFNEFVNDDDDLTFNNDKYAFMQKVLYFDDDVKKIVDDKIFKGYKLENEKSDHYFKESFILRFMDREISRQTIDSFASQLLYICITNREFINIIFSDEIKKYIENHEITEFEDVGKNDTTSNSDIINNNREITSTLPQSEVNLNVDDNELHYADENRISKDDTVNESKQKENTNNKHNGLIKKYSLDNLDKIYTMKERLFKEFDSKCFLQIW